MKLTNKYFLIWEFVVTLLLAAMPLMFYGENVTVILLIIVSYVITSAIGCMLLVKVKPIVTWIVTFVVSIFAYIIDITVIDIFRLIKMESYPLIIGQVYLLPIYILFSGLICAGGGVVMNKILKLKNGVSQ